MASKGLVSQGAYIEVSREQSIAGVTISASAKTLTRADGSFIDDGFEVGQRLETDALGNPGPLVITKVEATVLTVTGTVTDAASGTVHFIRFIRVRELINFGTPAGEPGEIEMTNLDSEAEEFRNSLRDEGSISGSMNFVPADAGQKVLAAMSHELTPSVVIITLPPYVGNRLSLDGYEWRFEALGRGMVGEIATKSRVTRALNLRISGAVAETIIPAGV